MSDMITMEASGCTGKRLSWVVNKGVGRIPSASEGVELNENNNISETWPMRDVYREFNIELIEFGNSEMTDIERSSWRGFL
jgi:hypothetical protein